MRLIIMLAMCAGLVGAEPAHDPPAVTALLKQAADLDVKIFEAKKAWLKSSVDYSPMDRPIAPSDPRESEMRAHNRAMNLYQAVREIGLQMDMVERGDPRWTDRDTRPGYENAYQLVMRHYDELLALGRIKGSETASGKPKEKPKLKATLADGTVVEQ